MFNLQGSEIIFILLLALVVLGPEKLPSAIRRFTQTYNELRKMGTGFQTELKSALDEPMREMKETADLLREQADPSKVASAAEEASESDAARCSEDEARQEFDAERRADSSDAGHDGGPAPVMPPTPTEHAAAPGAVDEWADPVDLHNSDDDDGPVQESA